MARIIRQKVEPRILKVSAAGTQARVVRAGLSKRSVRSVARQGLAGAEADISTITTVVNNELENRGVTGAVDFQSIYREASS